MDHSLLQYRCGRCPDQAKSYGTPSVVWLTSVRPKVELYDSGAPRHTSPSPHRFTNLRFHTVSLVLLPRVESTSTPLTLAV